MVRWSRRSVGGNVVYTLPLSAAEGAALRSVGCAGQGSELFVRLTGQVPDVQGSVLQARGACGWCPTPCYTLHMDAGPEPALWCTVPHHHEGDAVRNIVLTRDVHHEIHGHLAQLLALSA